jgi:hypothetical protein
MQSLRKTDLKQSGIAHRPNTRQHSLTSMQQQDKKPEEPVSRTQNKMDHTKLESSTNAMAICIMCFEIKY